MSDTLKTASFYMNLSNSLRACLSSHLQVELNVLTNGVLGMDLNMDCVAEKKIQEIISV